MTLAQRIDASFHRPRLLCDGERFGIALTFLDGARSAVIRQSRGLQTRESVELSGQIQALRMAMNWTAS
jgi:hypothetical protein